MKGAHFKLLILCLLIPIFANAQVGVGTLTPNGKLTIDASAETTAALELVPQATPTTNLANGQLAVIGDKLYMYDATRTKWLSIESTALQFGRGGDSVAQHLNFGGTVSNGNSGALMPFDGTIVAMTATSSGGTADKDFQIRVRNSATTNNVDFNLTANSFTDTTLNIDFSAGDFINTRARDFDGSLDAVTNLSIVIWVKWRQ